MWYTLWRCSAIEDGAIFILRPNRNGYQMKWLNLTASVAMAFVASGCGSVEPDSIEAPSAPAEMAVEERLAIADSVLATIQAFRVAVAAGDPDSIASFYADDPDMRWVEDGEVRYRSPADVAAAIRGFAGSVESSAVSYDKTEVSPVVPGVALLVTEFAQRFTTNDGQTGGFAGMITALLVSREGRWKFLNGHTSSAANR